MFPKNKKHIPLGSLGLIATIFLVSCGSNLEYFEINPDEIEFIELVDLDTKRTTRLSFRKTHDFLTILKHSRKTRVYKAFPTHEVTVSSYKKPDIKLYAGNYWIGPHVPSIEIADRFIVKEAKWRNFLKEIYKQHENSH